MGRHGADRRRAHAPAFAALAGIVILVATIAFAAHSIVARSARPHPARQVGSTTSSTPTLDLTVTGIHCRVLVRVPDGAVLLNRDLRQGQAVRFNDPQLDVVLADAGAARVLVNGQPRPLGQAGDRAEFLAVRP